MHAESLSTKNAKLDGWKDDAIFCPFQQHFNNNQDDGGDNERLFAMIRNGTPFEDDKKIYVILFK